jgi:hypothetical protein
VEKSLNGWLSMKGCKTIQTMPTVKDCDLSRVIKFRKYPQKTRNLSVNLS